MPTSREDVLKMRALRPTKAYPRKRGDLRIFPDKSVYRVDARGPWRRVSSAYAEDPPYSSATRVIEEI